MRKQIEGPNPGGTFGEDDLLEIPDFLDRRPNSAKSQNSAPSEQPGNHAAPGPDGNSTGEGPPPRPPQMEAARAYARRGWRVLPVHTGKDGTCTCGRAGCDSPAKHPRTAHGAKDATTDETQIRAWWTTRPNGNIGIATGTESGIVVVDLDPRNGGDKSLADFEAKHGSLPLTPKVRTGGGGAHFYFRPPGGKMACRAR